MNGISKKQKKMVWRIGVAMVLFLALVVWDRAGANEGLSGWFWIAAYMVPYLIVGYDVLWKAIRNIRNGQVFDENFLMAIATVAAFGIGEYSESVAVMLFYQIGEFFQRLAVERSRASIAQMMELAPETAWLEQDGELVEVDPEDVVPGDVIVIRPGEKIPLDGVILEGDSFLDTSALTGESALVEKTVGDEVISGCLNGDGTLKIRVEKAYEDSTVSVILELVENASEKKARLENFITRFARRYTPAVTLGAALLAVVGPLFFGLPWAPWIRRACIFLIVSCPCALVISVPLGFFCGIAAGSKIGVLVKGSNYLESLARAKTFAFDKTGTITRGVFVVTDTVLADGATFDRSGIVALAAEAEKYSNHPIARSLAGAATDESRSKVGVVESRELPGRGMRCLVTWEGGEPATLLVGNAHLMEEEGILGMEAFISKIGEDRTAVYVAMDGALQGAALLGDEIREESKRALSELKKEGVERAVMYTGDHRAVAARIAAEAGLDEFEADLLPQDKVGALEALIEKHGSVAYVGDGVNDAPVLMRSDVGIAMGAMGSDVAIEAADVVLMQDDLMKLPKIVAIAKKTTRIVKENIVFAITVKVVVLALGALGMASMWAAVFADVGVAVLAILNAMRSGGRDQ